MAVFGVLSKRKTVIVSYMQWYRFWQTFSFCNFYYIFLIVVGAIELRLWPEHPGSCAYLSTRVELDICFAQTP